MSDGNHVVPNIVLEPEAWQRHKLEVRFQMAKRVYNRTRDAWLKVAPCMRVTCSPRATAWARAVPCMRGRLHGFHLLFNFQRGRPYRR